MDKPINRLYKLCTQIM